MYFQIHRMFEFVDNALRAFVFHPEHMQEPNLARISIMFVIVKICHRIYILKLNLLSYLIVCVMGVREGKN